MGEYEDFQEGLLANLADDGVRIDGVYCCPHQRSDGCACKKPQPAMLRQCAEEHGIDLSASYVVGDNATNDILMARAAGCKAVLVRTGVGELSLGEYRHEWADVEADHIADDLMVAARWIIGDAASA